MSLMKQLWLAIACLMILAFGGSFVVSTLSARDYLMQQLQMLSSKMLGGMVSPGIWPVKRR